MSNETIIPLKYNGFCSRCQERTGPFYYKVIDNVNPSESGTYEFFGTIVKPDFVMVNNTRFNTRKAALVREKITIETEGKLMYTDTLKMSLDASTYVWNHNNQPAECLILEFTFHNDENGKAIEPIKLVFGNDLKIDNSPGEKYLVDKHNVQPNSIVYGYILPESSLDGAPELTDELLDKIYMENKENKNQAMRNNRLL